MEAAVGVLLCGPRLGVAAAADDCDAHAYHSKPPTPPTPPIQLLKRHCCDGHVCVTFVGAFVSKTSGLFQSTRSPPGGQLKKFTTKGGENAENSVKGICVC